MTTEILVQVTPQELRIPLAGLDASWQDVELELVREPQAILIRRKSAQPMPRHKLQNVVRDPGALYETDTPAQAQMTAKGLLLSSPMLQDWGEIEIIAEAHRIVIQPRVTSSSERQQVLQTLESCGFLSSVESLPADYIPLSTAEQVALTQAFSVGKPLSTIIIDEREGR
jgi:hypothetical protein